MSIITSIIEQLTYASVNLHCYKKIITVQLEEILKTLWKKRQFLELEFLNQVIFNRNHFCFSLCLCWGYWFARIRNWSMLLYNLSIMLGRCLITIIITTICQSLIFNTVNTLYSHHLIRKTIPTEKENGNLLHCNKTKQLYLFITLAVRGTSIFCTTSSKSVTSLTGILPKGQA